MDYMENVLYKEAVSLIDTYYSKGFAPKLYNILFYIQEAYWETSIPRLKDDVNEMADTLFKFKTDLSGRQPD
jgi:hypothetical protein